MLALAVVFPLVMAAAAPVIAIAIHRQGVPNYATHYRLVAQQVSQAWRETTDKPLAILGSYSRAMTAAEALAFVHEQQATWRPVMDKIAAKAN